MTSDEIKQWDELYTYVKNEILSYDEAQSIPPSLVLRLKGLTTGKFIENRNIEDRAAYSYEVVLLTFMAYKPAIINAIRTKNFKSETAKFNYICKIVENNLNDIYIRLNRANESKEKTKNINTDNIFHDGAKYKKQTKSTTNKALEGLW